LNPDRVILLRFSGFVKWLTDVLPYPIINVRESTPTPS